MESKIKAINEFLNKNNGVKIAIDGPAGSGKSTISHLLQDKINIIYVSMGNLFRALVCSLEENGIQMDSTHEIIEFIQKSQIQYNRVGNENQLQFNGRNHSHKLGNSDIADAASIIAANSELHKEMTLLIRRTLEQKNILIEGRATGSHIFPSANIKIFLDASLENRLERKYINAQSELINKEILEKKVEERDKRDRNRAYAPLVLNEDYIYINSSFMSIEDTLNLFISTIYSRLCVGNMENTEEIQERIIKILSLPDEEILYDSIEELYHLFIRLYMNKEHCEILKCNNVKSINPILLNMLGQRTNRFSEEREIWTYALSVCPFIMEAAEEEGINLFKFFLDCSDEKTLFIKAQNRICEKICNTVTTSETVSEREFVSIDGNSGEHGDIVLLIKPPVSSCVEAVKEIIDRISPHGYGVVCAKVLSGKYLRKDTGKITSFYKEAYEGYKDKTVSDSFIEKVKAIYDVSEFEFFFGEKFSPDMVIPGEALVKGFGISPQLINSIWDLGRKDIGIDRFKQLFGLDEASINDGHLVISKNGRSITYPVKGGKDNKNIQWFQSSYCFSINKVARARSVFPVKDKRIRAGKPTLIVNGQILGLIDMFTETDQTITIALSIKRYENASSMKVLREYFSGDESNPEKCKMGTIRRDAIEGKINFDFDYTNKDMLNGLKNVIHLSNGSLEGLAELKNFFGYDLKATAFGGKLKDNYLSESLINSLLKNPFIPSVNTTVFEGTAKMEPKDALDFIVETCQKKI